MSKMRVRGRSEYGVWDVGARGLSAHLCRMECKLMRENNVYWRGIIRGVRMKGRGFLGFRM